MEASENVYRPVIAVVFDASPLIFLDRLGYLPALRELHGTIIIPETVARELTTRNGLPASDVPSRQWVETRSVRDDLLQRVLGGPPSVEPGEAEVIALALELDGVVVIDDAQGRERAQRLGVELTGTIGQLQVLHQLSLTEGHALRSFEDDLQALAQAGMRRNDSLRRRAIQTRRVNE